MFLVKYKIFVQRIYRCKYPSVLSSVAKTAGLVGGSNVASNEVMLMKPIMRFLQLVCENHNRDLQVSVSGNCDIRCGEKSK